MIKDHFRLTVVEALPDYRLRLTYSDDKTFEVNLTERIKTSEFLAPINDPALFAQAKVGFGGRSVDWIEDEVDLGSDNLRHIAVEQTGGIGHERICTWLHQTGLTLEQAAEALGISRRMLIYYRDGEKHIPRAVWLACLGWDAVRPQGNALPLHAPSPSEYAALHA
jgi:predicted DNA-binding transcriptional regulator AlpA